MTLWLTSFAIAAGLLALTMQAGLRGSPGLPPLFVLVTHALALAHFFIGDLFHWSRVPRCSAPQQAHLCLLAIAGLSVFGLWGQAQQFPPLLMAYFVAHFWKDFEFGSTPAAPGPAVAAVRRVKRFSGALVVLAFLILSSGLITHPVTVTLAQRVGQGTAILLLLPSVRYFVRARPLRRAEELAIAQLAGVAAACLFAFTVIDAHHPLNTPLRYFFLSSHVTYWYLFYWARVRAQAAPARTPAPGGIEWLKHSPSRLTVFIIMVNLITLGGAWAYMAAQDAGPRLFWWLHRVYDPEWHYAVGAWAFLHITWNWPVKQVQGARVGY